MEIEHGEILDKGMSYTFIIIVAVVKSVALDFGFLYQNFLGAHMLYTMNVYYFSFNFFNVKKYLLK